MDFGLIKDAGLTQDEFGEMCGGVTRSTVSLWVTQRFKPHRYLHTTVQNTLDDIKAALDAGYLPLSDKLSKAERDDALKQVRNFATRSPA